jgi:hypothetical protein
MAKRMIFGRRMSITGGSVIRLAAVGKPNHGAIMTDVPLENAAALIDTMVDQPGLVENCGVENAEEYSEALRRVYVEFHPKRA